MARKKKQENNDVDAQIKELIELAEAASFESLSRDEQIQVLIQTAQKSMGEDAEDQQIKELIAAAQASIPEDKDAKIKEVFAAAQASVGKRNETNTTSTPTGNNDSEGKGTGEETPTGKNGENGNEQNKPDDNKDGTGSFLGDLGDKSSTVSKVVDGFISLFKKDDNDSDSESSVSKMYHDLDEVKVDTAFANEAFNVMASISFDKLIGNPLQAAIKAQRSMAKETLAFLKSDGMINDQDQLVYVTMVFKQNGKEAKLRVPLITLVPYPSLLISEMKYHFTAKIDALSSVVVAAGKDIPVDLAMGSSGSSKSATGGAGGTGGPGAGGSGGTNAPSSKSESTTPTSTPSPSTTQSTPITGANASLSAKYGSGVMRGSRYNVETTMDVMITATQQDQPKGLTHIIDVLDQSVEVVNTNGELVLSTEQATLSGNYVVVAATYRTPKGDYDPYQVKCAPLPNDEGKSPKMPKLLLNGDDVLLLFSEKGTYTVKAGKYNRIVFVN